MLGVFAEFERAMIAERVRAGLRGPEVKESASGGPQFPLHSKNESVRPWRLLGAPVCASLRNSLESILGQCSASAALSRQARPSSARLSTPQAWRRGA
jgi:hypothetical protein